MLFLQGSEVIFKVALSLLGSHKPLILQHENLESIVDFIKTMLPKLGLVQMEKTINQVRKTQDDDPIVSSFHSANGLTGTIRGSPTSPGCVKAFLMN